MLTDKNGKQISVGSRVKLSDGTHRIVRGTLATSAPILHANEVEVVTGHEHGDKAADGDSIIWGS